MNGHLATVVPWFNKLHLPINRDKAFILFVAVNELVMGFETFLAHYMNGTIRFNEWIPIVTGPLFALLLILSLFTSKKNVTWANFLVCTASFGSILVGTLGTYFHIIRAVRPFAAVGERINLRLLVWGAPAFAPPTFILVGVLALVALSSANGQNHDSAFKHAVFRHLPFSKDKIYFVLTSFGAMIATVSSLFDHLRGGFHNPWLWIPTISGMFAIVIPLLIALVNEPQRGDLTVYTVIMVILLGVGPLGLILHILFDLGPGGVVIVERLLKGAPILAPMVFANMGLLGVIVLLDPE